MFVQVMKGKTSDREAVERQNQRWVDEVKPGAKGYLGATVGVADDGTVFVLARFEDQAAAQANAQRPEQDAWYQETVKYLDGEPTFRESSDTSLLFDGGSNDAGFVQVMEGTVKDRAKAEAIETPELLEELRKARPDLLGGIRVWFDGGAYVEVAYFTSEADARKGESSGEFQDAGDEFTEAFGEMTYIDLKNPLLD